MHYFVIAFYVVILIPVRLWNRRRQLFSFRGRVGRQTYWLALGMHFLLALIYGGLLSGVVEAARGCPERC
jgi:uncharacterized membrane protein YhaH (DUF805 family)